MNLFDLIVVQPIFNLLMALYSIVPGGDFGVAVIIFTILIRIIMWPLISKQLHQVKIMRKIQPELDRIKKQAKGNRQMQGMMMLEVYKKYNISPFRSIGLTLIQLPIFFGLYRVIQIFTMHRGDLGKYTYNLLENIPAVSNLIANPNNFNNKLFGFVDLTVQAIGKSGISPLLLALAIGAGIMQYISSKQTMPQKQTKKGLRQIMAEAAEGKEADSSEMNAAVMQKMVKFMPIMLTLIMVNLPGAIALYSCTFTAVAVVQQHFLLKKDEDELQDIADKSTLKKRVSKAQVAEIVEPKILKPKKVASKKSKSSAKTTVRVVSASKKGGKK